MKKPLWTAVKALKEIQYVYTGAGQSYEDLKKVKAITESALRRLGLWEMSLAEFKKRSGEFLK